MTSSVVASAWLRFTLVTRARTTSPGSPRRTNTTKPFSRATPLPPYASDSILRSSSSSGRTGAAMRPAYGPGVELRFDTPSTTRHFEQWAAILERVSGDVFDVDELAHFVSSDTESTFLLALDGDEALGCGVGRPSSIQTSLYAMVRVLPQHHGQGVGTRIYEQLSAHARKLGRESLWGRVREDDADSREFLRNRGFREAGREYEVVLDTALAETEGDPPAGIELVSLAERPELEPAVHEVDCEVAADVPRPEGDDFEPQSRSEERRVGK